MFSSFSIMAFRACAADVLGNVCALISSDLSACLRSRADVLLELRDVLSSRSKTLEEIEKEKSMTKEQNYSTMLNGFIVRVRLNTDASFRIR